MILMTSVLTRQNLSEATQYAKPYSLPIRLSHNIHIEDIVSEKCIDSGRVK